MNNFTHNPLQKEIKIIRCFEFIITKTYLLSPKDSTSIDSTESKTPRLNWSMFFVLHTKPIQ